MATRAIFISRYITAGGFSLIVIFGLFWIMQYLINIADRKLDEDDPGRMPEFVRINPEEVVNRHEPPPKPDTLQEPPQVVIVPPDYPGQAIVRSIERGYVIVEFTVTKSGTTRDIRIVEAVPPGIFDKASLAAAASWKYEPRVIDAQPVDVPGVQRKITFELEDQFRGTGNHEYSGATTGHKHVR